MIGTVGETPLGDDIVKTVTLAVEQYVVNHLVHGDYVFATRPRVAVRRLAEHVGALCVQMIQDVAVQRIPEVVRYPADWWEAFKARWFPAWALARWPVRETIYDAKVLYPEVEIPERMHVIRLYTADWR